MELKEKKLNKILKLRGGQGVPNGGNNLIYNEGMKHKKESSKKGSSSRIWV